MHTAAALGSGLRLTWYVCVCTNCESSRHYIYSCSESQISSEMLAIFFSLVSRIVPVLEQLWASVWLYLSNTTGQLTWSPQQISSWDFSYLFCTNLRTLLSVAPATCHEEGCTWHLMSDLIKLWLKLQFKRVRCFHGKSVRLGLFFLRSWTLKDCDCQ